MRTAPLRAIGVGPERVRERSVHGRGRGEARASTRSVPAAHCSKHALARARAIRSRKWRGWPTGGSKRAGRGLGFAYLDYCGTQVAGVAEVSVDRASGAIRVHEFWCTIDCGVAGASRQRRSRRPRARSSTGWASRSPSASRSRTARCSSRTSSTTTCRGMKDLPRIAHQVDPDAEPADRRGADGDTARRARDIERRVRSPACACASSRCSPSA